MDKVKDTLYLKLPSRYQHDISQFQTLEEEVLYLERYHQDDRSLYAFLKDEFIRLEERFKGIIFKSQKADDVKIDDVTCQHETVRLTV